MNKDIYGTYLKFEHIPLFKKILNNLFEKY